MLRIDYYRNNINARTDRLDGQLHSKQEEEKAVDKKEDNKKVLEDQFTISDESRKLLEEKKAEIDRQMEEKLSMIERFKEEVEAAKEAGNPYDDILKCIKIASRIMKGDRVPNRDMSYLAEHQPDMFSAAIMFRTNNEKPKSHKSLLEDPKDKIMETFMEDIEGIMDEGLERVEEITGKEI